ncbi:hypothetical protein [Cellulosilyticum ruminicola]
MLKQGYKGKDILLIGGSARAGLVLSLPLYLKNHGIEISKACVAMSPWQI